jgi:hypothetical protein
MMNAIVDDGRAVAVAPAVVRRAWPMSVTTVVAAVCFAALVLACLGLYWTGWAATPISLRFIVGVIVFGISPGMLIVGPFLSSRKYQLDTSDLVISVVTCSFSCNLVLNAVLFALHWSLTDLVRAYVFVQLAGYAAWGAWFYSRGYSVASATPRVAPETSLPRWLFTALLAASAAVVYIMFVNGAPITNSEELVWLRKLVENPSVRYDNVSYRLGDPSTYLFVPFQIFIGGASIVARADLALTYSLFWGVTTALSIFVITRLAYVVFGRAEVAALACLWMLAIALFEPDSMIYGAGLVVPFPNRYGFAGGVLLPLILLLFWSVLRDQRVHLWRWALLIYVAVEVTFVHARETLLGVGMMVAALAILAVRPGPNRRTILRIALVIAITGVVLVAYKKVNLALAPDLDAYVGAMTRACRTALVRLLADHGPTDLLSVGVPRFTEVVVDGSTPIKIGFSTYDVMFLDTWGYKLLARLCLPLALVILPFYALRARSVAELSVAAMLAGLGVVLRSGFLNLVVSAIVGSPEILIVYNVIALLSLLVVCAAVWDLGASLARWARVPPARISISGSTQSGSTKTLSVALSLWLLINAAVVGVVVWSYYSTDRIVAWVGDFAARWRGPFGQAMMAATVLAIVYRAIRRDLPVFAPVQPAPPLALFTSGCLMAALLLPVVQRSPVWEKNPFTPAYPSYRFTGDFVKDYPMLVAPASKKLDPSPYPVEVVQYFRQSLPPNRTLLASDALALMERVPHFAAVLSNKGEVASQYIVNNTYLRDYSRSGTNYAIAPFLEDDDGVRAFAAMLSDFRIDVILVDPKESDAVRAARERSDVLRSQLRPVFDAGGYVIYLVDRPRAPSVAP